MLTDGNITYARGSFVPPYGLISTDWKKDNNQFDLAVYIPVNTSADIYLRPKATSAIYVNGTLWKSKVAIKNETAVIAVSSGEYRFVVK